MTTFEKIQDQINTVKSLKNAKKENRLLSLRELSICRKLEIPYSVRYGAYNGYGYEKLGQELQDTEEEFNKKIKSYSAKLRRTLKKLEKRPLRKTVSPSDRIKRMIEKDEKGTVAIALYNLNKIAKVYRDKASSFYNGIYGDGDMIGTSSQHDAMHNAISRKNELYEIKDKYLTLATKRYDLDPIGFHEFNDRDRDLYELAGFSFHSNHCVSKNSLGRIDTEISSEKTGKKMSEKTVMLILTQVFDQNEKTA